jgi:hypothetical protein
VIYQGLTTFLDLPKLTHQACSRSPTSKTLFLLERELKTFFDTRETTFPIQQTPLKAEWLNKNNYRLLPPQQKSHNKNISQQTISIHYNHVGSNTKPKWHHHLLTGSQK